MNEMKSILQWWLLSQFSTSKNWAFGKVIFQGTNFGVPVYKGAIPPWIKWIPSFSEDYSLTAYPPPPPKQKKLQKFRIGINRYKSKITNRTKSGKIDLRWGGGES